MAKALFSFLLDLKKFCIVALLKNKNSKVRETKGL